MDALPEKNHSHLSLTSDFNLVFTSLLIVLTADGLVNKYIMKALKGFPDKGVSYSHAKEWVCAPGSVQAVKSKSIPLLRNQRSTTAVSLFRLTAIAVLCNS